MSHQKVWRGVFALLVVLVTFMTLTPDPDDTAAGLAIARFLAELLFRNPEVGDKIAHFLAYAALGGSATFGSLRIADRRWATVIVLAAYGAMLEFAQGAGGVRVADFTDALANSGGALAAFPAALAVEMLIARRRSI